MKRLLPLLFLSLLFPSPSTAKLVKVKGECGPPIPRSEVTVLDVSELPQDAQVAEVEKLGDVEFTREAVVEVPRFLKAWKRAEGEAADLGCPFVVVVGSWLEVKGLVSTGNGFAVPAKKQAIRVLYGRPRVVESE